MIETRSKVLTKMSYIFNEIFQRISICIRIKIL